jgi:hypothetical protein
MVRSTKAGAKARSRRADRTENAVFGALMAAFMGVSPFVANVVVPPMEQAEIAHRVELAQSLAAAGFAAGLGMIGWLTRQSLGRRRQAA